MAYHRTGASVAACSVHGSQLAAPLALRRLRLLQWHATVWGLLVLLLVVLPFYHSYRLLSSSGEHPPRASIK